MRGFIPARGTHRHNQLNAFGLAGDLIEPFRPAVDLVVLSAVGSSPRLTRNQRGAPIGVFEGRGAHVRQGSEPCPGRG